MQIRIDWLSWGAKGDAAAGHKGHRHGVRLVLHRPTELCLERSLTVRFPQERYPQMSKITQGDGI
jgi:hypothetical protein